MNLIVSHTKQQSNDTQDTKENPWLACKTVKRSTTHNIGTVLVPQEPQTRSHHQPHLSM